MPASSLPNLMDATALRAPRGAQRRCRGWVQEAALRMLLNACDPDVAERAGELVTHGGFRPAAGRDALRELVAHLESLDERQALYVADGRVAEVLDRIPIDPAIVIEADPAFADAATAGWVYVGAAALLPTAWSLLAHTAREHFAGSLAGKLVLGLGLEGWRAAQPLAATLNRGAFLGIDPDPLRIKRCLRVGLCDIFVNDLDEALRILKSAVRKHDPVSVILAGDANLLLPEMVRRGVVPDVITGDDPGFELLPGSAQPALETLEADGALRLSRLYGDGLRELSRAHRALLFISLGGAATDLRAVDHVLAQIYPHDHDLMTWLALAQRHLRAQGLPARAAWLPGSGDVELAAALNAAVAHGSVSAPLLIVAGEFFAAPQAIPLHLAPAGADWVARVVAADGPHSIAARVVDGDPASLPRLEQFLLTAPRRA